MSIDKQSFIDHITSRIEAIRVKVLDSGNKWVVASDTVVRVTDDGINGTGFSTRRVGCASVAEYPSFAEAQRNVDPYLVDCYGSFIVNKPLRAAEYYMQELEALNNSIHLIKHGFKAV